VVPPWHDFILQTASAPGPTPFLPTKALTMAEVKKQERDFTVEVDALLPEASSLVKVSLHR
jgi:hypothetical protein